MLMFGIFCIESKTRRSVCLALILLSDAWRRRKCFMITDVCVCVFFLFSIRHYFLQFIINKLELIENIRYFVFGYVHCFVV